MKRLVGILLMVGLAIGLAWGLWSTPAVAAGSGLGSDLLASCSFVPDFSTQEYRPSPVPSESDLAESDLAESVTDADEGGDPDLNLWQRFWRGLFGG